MNNEMQDSTQNWTVGHIYLDRFRIENRLGSGLIGVVYQAYDLQLERMVALKVLHPELFEDSLTRARFVFGARVANHLDSEHVVQLLDSISTDDAAFLVYEFMAGGSLADKIQNNQPLKVADALNYAQQIAEIMEAAHKSGVFHRALNLSAIFFDQQGKLKIGEFGAADVPQSAFDPVFIRPLETKDQRHSLSYLAPEQIIRKKEDEPCDVYAMAAILYHLLTGKPCLDFTSAETPDDLQNIVLTQMPLAPSQFNPRVPPWLDTVILKALQKYPRFRFETVKEFRLALEAKDFVVFAPINIEVEEDEYYLEAQEKVHRQQKREQMYNIGKDVLRGIVMGFIGGLLLCSVSYGARIALTGWKQEGMVAACISATLLSTLIGASMGWVVHCADDAQSLRR